MGRSERAKSVVDSHKRAMLGGKIKVYGQVIQLVNTGHDAASIAEWCRRHRSRIPGYEDKTNEG